MLALASLSALRSVQALRQVSRFAQPQLSLFAQPQLSQQALRQVSLLKQALRTKQSQRLETPRTPSTGFVPPIILD